MNCRYPLAALALLAIQHGAIAQPAPTGGEQLQRITPVPVPVKPLPEFRFDPGSGPVAPADDSTKIPVKTLRLNGQTVFPESELLAASEFAAGELSLNDLRACANKIAAYYRVRGYFVAQAVLPAQDVKNGEVLISVSEGQYGKVQINNEAGLSTSLTDQLMDGVKAGDPITVSALEERLLLLNDLPGVNVKSNLVPGASVGAADLIIEVKPGQRVTGSAEFDNQGSRYTGQERIGASVNFNQLAGLGDVASLRALTSLDGLNYFRGSYQIQLGRTKVGAAFTALDYKLGREFSDLKANGTAEIATLYASYPIIRTRSTNLSAQLAFDSKSFRDKVDSTATVTDKDVNVLMASLVGDSLDSFLGGGINTYALTLSSGNINIQTPSVRANDDATLRTNGRYEKFSLTATRLQRITDDLTFFASLTGQMASKNLDASEKMSLGGPYAVRAYPSGEAFADDLLIANLELRQSLPRLFESQSGQMQLIGFFDSGTARLVHDPVGSGDNRRSLSATGVGLGWAQNADFMVKAYFARKVGNATAVSEPDETTRFWIQAIKYF